MHSLPCYYVLTAFVLGLFSFPSISFESLYIQMHYHMLPADVLGHFSFPSVSVESLHIQMHHHQFTLGDNNYRYTA